MSPSLQENGIAVTTGTPSRAVEVEFPEIGVGTTGAVVIAGELDGSSESLEAEALFSAAALEVVAASALDSPTALEPESAAALELASASSVLELAEVALAEAATVADSRTVAVEV